MWFYVPVMRADFRVWRNSGAAYLPRRTLYEGLCVQTDGGGWQILGVG